MKKILIIAPHPDDETLGCGGTILKHVANGDRVYWVIVTSINNHPNPIFSKSQIEKRSNTISKVAKELGIYRTIEFGLPTTLLHKVDMSKLISLFDHSISEIEPTDIYVNFSNDVHSDHRIIFNSLYACTKSFRKPFIKNIFMYETLSETEFAPTLNTSSFIPNVYVDITEFMKNKIEIMKLYDTELMVSPYPRSLSSIESLARYRGSRAAVEYAESFMLIYCKC